jgi:hypothetical protein
MSGTVLSNGFTDLKLTFTSATMIIGTTFYTIPSRQSINFSLTTLNGVAPLSGGVPEPRAGFLLGMGALGLMGLAKVSRKMIRV